MVTHQWVTQAAILIWLDMVVAVLWAMVTAVVIHQWAIQPVTHMQVVTHIWVVIQWVIKVAMRVVVQLTIARWQAIHMPVFIHMPVVTHIWAVIQWVMQVAMRAVVQLTIARWQAINMPVFIHCRCSSTCQWSPTYGRSSNGSCRWP